MPAVLRGALVLAIVSLWGCRPVEANVEVTLAGSGVGVVTSSPAGLSCPGSCGLHVAPGTEVTLEAVAAPGSSFGGWEGGCTGSGACRVTPGADVTITATFGLKNGLVVTRAGSGGGTVTSTPAGIDCGVDCSESWAPDTLVTLTATPDLGSTFTGWGGACSGTGPCSPSTSAAQSVTATFALSQATLSVTKAGNGMGTVVSAPAGVDCGAACVQPFAWGSPVTLAASPGANSLFVGWSGACSGTAPCTVPMTGATSVTATFALQRYDLAVTTTGAGMGLITSNPAGIDCGSSCRASFEAGTSVTLVAAPAANSVFTGWSGACSGDGACTVPVTMATGVTAAFGVRHIDLSVNKLGTGTGLISASPAGIDCGAVCTAPYDWGTMVSLTAAPTGGSSFTGWTGACGGTGTCVVTLLAATSVTANLAAVLEIDPATKTLVVGNDFTFTASGGVLPRTFSIPSGGGSVGATTGLYTAAATPGSVVVRVTDALGATADATVTVNAPLAISPATKALPVRGTFVFSATGGVPPLTFSLQTGVGSIVAASGLYTAPGAVGTAVIRVTDALFNTADATVNVRDLFSPAVNYASGTAPDAVTTGDWNGDGKADLAVANQSSGTVSIFRGVGDGTFQAALNSTAGSSPSSLAVADWNRDGKTDLAVTHFFGSAVSILLGVGDGTFGAGVDYASGSNANSVTAGDWNADGKADLVVANNFGSDVSVLLGVGDGTFLAAVHYPVGASPQAIAAGDWNGDGKVDLAVASGNGVSILRGVGDGTFQAAVTYPVGPTPSSVTSGDWNGDGHADLALTTASLPITSNVSILLGVGDGTFQPASTFGADASAREVKSGDWNGDGHADLAVANQSGNDVSILLGLGDGTFRAPVNYATGGNAGWLTAGDWNADGKLDLAVANLSNNNVSVLLNQAP